MARRTTLSLSYNILACLGAVVIHVMAKGKDHRKTSSSIPFTATANSSTWNTPGARILGCYDTFLDILATTLVKVFFPPDVIFHGLFIVLKRLQSRRRHQPRRCSGNIWLLNLRPKMRKQRQRSSCLQYSGLCILQISFGLLVVPVPLKAMGTRSDC